MNRSSGDDLVEQRVGVVEQFAGHRLIENRRVLALELPGQEQELPVDHCAQVFDLRADDLRAHKCGRGQIVEGDDLPVGPGLVQAQQAFLLPVGVLVAQALLLGPVVGVELLGPLRVEQVRHHADDAGRIEHVQRRRVVRGGDAHCRVLTRRRGAADQQRQLETAALHLGGDRHHLVERRRDQAGQPDGVGIFGDGGVEDLRGRHHDPEVDHPVVVASEYDTHDVLADVVHVALDGREDDGALPASDSDRPSSLACSFSASMNGSR